jgi:hypothetical protein
MKKLYTILIALILASSALADSITNRLVGTWSNNKEGFGICTLSFRTDGRGIINAAGVAGAALRWRDADDGIAITIAAPPENPTIHAQLSTDSQQLSFALPDSETQTFWRVSSQEPPDYEKQAEVRRNNSRERHASRHVSTTNTLKTADAVLEYARAFANSSSNQLTRSRIRFGSSKVLIRLHKVSTQTSITFTSLTAHRKLPEETTAATGVYSKTPPDGDFTIERFVAEKPAEQFMRWLSEKNIKCECAYYHYKTMWGIKGYSQFCAAYIKEDPEQVRQTFSFLLKNVFPDLAPPYEIIETRKK